MVCSVTTSIFAVASSRMTILFLRSMALMMQISCLSPMLKFFPSSMIMKLRPKLLSIADKTVIPCYYSNISCFDLPSNKYSRPAFLIKSMMRSSVDSLKGSIFMRSVPSYIIGSYGIIVILFLRTARSS